MTPQERRYWRNRQRAIEKWKAEHPDPPEGMMFEPRPWVDWPFISIAEFEELAERSFVAPKKTQPLWWDDPSYHWRKKA